MTHLEFFINRVNVNDVPKLNKEQFLLSGNNNIETGILFSI